MPLGIVSPGSWGAMIFLLFDGVKPFLASWFDTHQGGSFGIMLDDTVASVYAFLILQIGKYVREKRHQDRSRQM
ncbi:phosphatidylglycerophosphatase A [Desulfocastanea catecholica]